MYNVLVENMFVICCMKQHMCAAALMTDRHNQSNEELIYPYKVLFFHPISICPVSSFVSIGSAVSDNSFMYRQIYTSILCVYSSDTRVLGSIANFSRPPNGQNLASTEHVSSCQNVPGVCVEHEVTNKSMA